ncbi:hypothetical protein AC1031_005386 [Aphanomyces cochlioides]|nr:hypothetical protein AC1031_005386 [Aphanomyces cochlioides]
MKTQALVALIAVASTAQATTCGKDVAQIFLTATTSAEALTCAKESGVSLSPSTTYTEMDLTKALATPSCLSYWDGVIKKVIAVSPACDFPSPLNDGSMLNTATFKWTLKDLFGLAISAPTTANSTALITGSSTSPTWGNSTNLTTIIAPRPDSIKPGASGNSFPTASPAKPTTTPQSLSSVVARVSCIVVVGVVLLA